MSQPAKLRPSLLKPSEMPPVPGLEVPSSFYTVALDPVPIAGMAWPASGTPWAEIGRLGFRHVICLAGGLPDYRPSPLRIACAIPLTDQVSQAPPEPLREERRIRNAVEVAVDKVRLGEGVVLHCVGGTGRTGTVIGCLLRALGLTGPEVRAYLQAVHRARGKSLRGGDWLESDWQRNLVTGFRL